MSLPTSTKVITLVENPTGVVTEKTFSLQTTPLEPLKENQVLLKHSVLSNGPAIRSWIDSAYDKARWGDLHVYAGQPVVTEIIAEVIASTSEQWPVGKYVKGLFPWAQYSVQSAEGLQPAILIEGFSPWLSLSVFGFNGLTAYLAIFSELKLKKEDVVCVSSAAGSLGTLFVQLAAKVVGCTVIGIASGPKCEWVKSLGAKDCVDYKAPDFDARLSAALPGGCDVFFDNVGGAVLDAMIKHVKFYGRISVCGALSTYNHEPTVLQNWVEVVLARLNIKGEVTYQSALTTGYMVTDHFDKLPQAIEHLTQLVKDGTLQADAEEIVEAPIEDVAKLWISVFNNGPKGKFLTKLV
ncbi:hypothetical protein BCR39DRAFT_257564 [Naematelia encephala]|uniref:Enoyl reductase (ER) domain-containing protein n=1 Tax=Naematelia encephala TaxID=71784 RepID=A0A1Y2AVH7_9TREE|nr:hypothetical protein BCR39DRAFT_257564 [Naematelia encephala]